MPQKEGALASAATGDTSSLGRSYWHHRYTVLFYVLLGTMVTAPILTALKFNGTLIETLLGGCLLAAILPVGAVRNRPYLLIAVVVVWLARMVTAWLNHRVLSDMTLGLWTFIGLVAAVAALRFAIGAKQVDAEHLYAALSAYLLAGIYFGLCYWILEEMKPGTFSYPGEFSQASAIYFSFVTLATLGYGDITPRADVARSIAIVEGVGGQFFLAILVARLVSLYSKRENQSS
ncbi:MAG TPA: potassium channel family protein [Candidatus Acidoferrum sp.]